MWTSCWVFQTSCEQYFYINKSLSRVVWSPFIFPYFDIMIAIKVGYLLPYSYFNTILAIWLSFTYIYFLYNCFSPLHINSILSLSDSPEEALMRATCTAQDGTIILTVYIAAIQNSTNLLWNKWYSFLKPYL